MGRRTGRKGKRVPAKVNPSQLRDLAERFALLGSEPRLRLLMALMDGPKHVTYLCESLGLGQPTVSNHLMRLKWGGLVASVRDSRRMVYHHLPGSLRALVGTLRSLAGKV